MMRGRRMFATFYIINWKGEMVMNFSEKIFEIRKGLGLSQEEFGSMVNVSRQAVSKWELGQSKPDIDTLILLCQTLNISSDELILSNSHEELSEGRDKSSFDLQEFLLEKRRFVLGIVMMMLGILGLFWLWLDIRVGSRFMQGFWNGLLNPMEFAQFIISILIIIKGFIFSHNTTKPHNKREEINSKH
jgi:transcriptional regulator with XRE-family HTH domain